MSTAMEFQYIQAAAAIRKCHHGILDQKAKRLADSAASRFQL